MNKKKNKEPEMQENTQVQDTDDEPNKSETTIEEISFSLYEKRSYDALVAIFNEIRAIREELKKND